MANLDIVIPSLLGEVTYTMGGGVGVNIITCGVYGDSVGGYCLNRPLHIYTM